MFTRIAIFIVSVCSFNSGDGAYSRSDKIVYPGPTVNSRQGYEPPIVPESCKNLTYCFEPPSNYPQERYNKMFEGKKVAPLPSIVETEVVNRLADDDYNDDCNAEVRSDRLYSIKTKEGDWRHIIQAPTENFQQRVRIEVCTALETSCFKDFPSFGGITTFCRQKQAKYEFVVDDGMGGSAKMETELPSCCVCHYKAPV
ncbi:uncharacterized protein LOC106142917 [Amyelois transitella]|uniref:uncharacterized protein LOC106142917 n=1 Tax=Amyelois transitella TaxID=680683 RepID=UPI00067A77EE|nr:uncharacterized protein LOC106142917 [Amyelois transitella]